MKLQWYEWWIAWQWLIHITFKPVQFNRCENLTLIGNLPAKIAAQMEKRKKTSKESVKTELWKCPSCSFTHALSVSLPHALVNYQHLCLSCWCSLSGKMRNFLIDFFNYSLILLQEICWNCQLKFSDCDCQKKTEGESWWYTHTHTQPLYILLIYHCPHIYMHRCIHTYIYILLCVCVCAFGNLQNFKNTHSQQHISSREQSVHDRHTRQKSKFICNGKLLAQVKERVRERETERERHRIEKSEVFLLWSLDCCGP